MVTKAADQKHRVLEAWQMVEYLSEGDINVKDRDLLSLQLVKNDEYYEFFQQLMRDKLGTASRSRKGGLVVYFDIFPFREVISMLREKFNLPQPAEEIPTSHKFSFALYFTTDLDLDADMTFLTASFYIRAKQEIPDDKDFTEFEEQNNEKFSHFFDFEGKNDSRQVLFNRAIRDILQEFRIDPAQCTVKALKNMETDATNLHSFFVSDLEKAKDVDSQILDDYLLGRPQQRIDLNSRVDSPHFARRTFQEILQPQNYALSRFPTNPQFSLSLMQQVAVNLALGFGGEQMMSVNGPPGTGKTTLLKDIFAELVVRQARAMSQLKDKEITGEDAIRVDDFNTVGIVPEDIAANGIVVASSNNGAVQNIVNELPLTQEIHDEFRQSIINADYFKEIANSAVRSQWIQGDDGKTREELTVSSADDEEKFWGLFSLEGGRKENVETILNKIRLVVDYLKTEYEPNPDIYDEFDELYAEVQRVRDLRATQGEVVSAEGQKTGPLDFSQPYDDLHLSNPWFDIEYRRLQSRLFIAALRVRKEFLYKNRKSLASATRIWKAQNRYADHLEAIEQAWNWINLAVPVISSTFASFSRMCSKLGTNAIGHLFVDEAGQALPQASVGAIFRSRKVMVVGDPSQIKPVLTLDPYVLDLLARRYGVQAAYLSEDASTQTLVDASSKFGFYKDAERTDWIGVPLWVHRRCQYPMFDISNAISYGGNMVQGNKKYGKAQWLDVTGQATRKYVAEQGEALKRIIQELAKNDPTILDHSAKDVIYVISPFRNVAFQLARTLNEIGFTRSERGKPTNVGTVHTFQGKEAPIVFLVLGADDKSKGAAAWAMGTDNPNIMNVAATRAKKEFYVIGDKRLYAGLDSHVVDETLRIINKFNREHPPARESKRPVLPVDTVPAMSTAPAAPSVRQPVSPTPPFDAQRPNTTTAPEGSALIIVAEPDGSVLLNVPYEQKDEAKSLGARWNPRKKKWYVPKGLTNYADFRKWLPNNSGH